MPVVLRIVLIVSSILMLIYMLKKVKKSKVQIEHTIFWIIFGVILILISLIPQIVYLFAHLLGIQSPANLVLVFIIFILLIKQFLMTIEMSQLEIKIRELVEEIALKEKIEKLKAFGDIDSAGDGKEDEKADKKEEKADKKADKNTDKKADKTKKAKKK